MIQTRISIADERAALWRRVGWFGAAVLGFAGLVVLSLVVAFPYAEIVAVAAGIGGGLLAIYLVISWIMARNADVAARTLGELVIEHEAGFEPGRTVAIKVSWRQLRRADLDSVEARAWCRYPRAEFTEIVAQTTIAEAMSLGIDEPVIVEGTLTLPDPLPTPARWAYGDAVGEHRYVVVIKYKRGPRWRAVVAASSG